MSLDLTLLPVEFDGGTWGFSHSVLRVDQGRLWSDLLEHVRMVYVPDKFSTYLSRDDKFEETHYGNTQRTPYGEQLLAARIEDILPALDKHLGDWSRRDRAVIAYLRVMDPKMKVALYWH